MEEHNTGGNSNYYFTTTVIASNSCFAGQHLKTPGVPDSTAMMWNRIFPSPRRIITSWHRVLLAASAPFMTSAISHIYQS